MAVRGRRFRASRFPGSRSSQTISADTYIPYLNARVERKRIGSSKCARAIFVIVVRGQTNVIETGSSHENTGKFDVSSSVTREAIFEATFRAIKHHSSCEKIAIVRISSWLLNYDHTHKLCIYTLLSIKN